MIALDYRMKYRLFEEWTQSKQESWRLANADDTDFADPEFMLWVECMPRMRFLEIICEVLG